MYPFRNGWRWLAFGRYSHLVRAVKDRPELAVDPTLNRRVNSLRTWNLVRFAVSIPLSAGLAATVASAIVSLLPETAADQAAEDAFDTFLVVATGLTGILTAIYLFLTRLLGQIEVDILARLILRPESN